MECWRTHDSEAVLGDGNGRIVCLHEALRQPSTLLPTGQQAVWRRKLQRAYEQPTSSEAKAALDRLARELRGAE